MALAVFEALTALSSRLLSLNVEAGLAKRFLMHLDAFGAETRAEDAKPEEGDLNDKRPRLVEGESGRERTDELPAAGRSSTSESAEAPSGSSTPELDAAGATSTEELAGELRGQEASRQNLSREAGEGFTIDCG